jgi:hypothetical protein
MQTINLKLAPEVKAVIQAAFPGYKKHSAFLSEFSSVSINSYWDGGSKSYYALVELATNRTKALPTSTHPYYDLNGANGSNQDVTVQNGVVTLNRLPEGFALVENGTFCGKPATAHVWVNAANLTKLLEVKI